MMEIHVVILIFGFVALAKASNFSRDDVHMISAKHHAASSPCKEDSDCEDLKDAKCVNFFCQCNNNQSCAESIVESRIVTKLGEICTKSAECNIEHSVCEEGMCMCEKGKVGSNDKRRCLKMSMGLESDCHETVQCYTKDPLSYCEMNTCKCQEKTHEYNGICYKDVALGDTCGHKGECSLTTFSRCIDDKCTCETGYVPNNSSTKCLKIAEKGNDICYEDIQCQKGLGRAICKEGFCQCEELFEYKKSRGTCVKDLQIDELCTNHTDCHGIEKGESRLECILGQCKCRSSFTEISGSCTKNSGSCTFGSLLMLVFNVASVILYFFV